MLISPFIPSICWIILVNWFRFTCTRRFSLLNKIIIRFKRVLVCRQNCKIYILILINHILYFLLLNFNRTLWDFIFVYSMLWNCLWWFFCFAFFRSFETFHLFLTGSTFFILFFTFVTSKFITLLRTLLLRKTFMA